MTKFQSFNEYEATKESIKIDQLYKKSRFVLKQIEELNDRNRIDQIIEKIGVTESIDDINDESSKIATGGVVYDYVTNQIQDEIISNIITDDDIMNPSNENKFITQPIVSEYTKINISQPKYGTISGLNGELRSVCYGNGTFVAVGSSGACYYSINGASWNSISGIDSSVTLRSVCYGNGTFVACGGKISGYVYYSKDGITWSEQIEISAVSVLNSVCFGNDMFMVVGNNGAYSYSNNGVSWSPVNNMTYNILLGVCYGNNTFVAVGLGSACYYSDDGKTWIPGSGLSDIGTLYSVGYGNGIFIAVSYNFGDSNISYYSKDGKEWTAMDELNNANLSICYGNGVFVAVGDSSAYYSFDGLTWIPVTSGDLTGTLYGMCYGNAMFVIVGYNGDSKKSVCYTLKFTNIDSQCDSIQSLTNNFSTINETTTSRYIDKNNIIQITDSGLTGTLGRICYGNGMFVALNGSKVYYSTDGKAWGEGGGVSGHLYDVCYGNGTFILLNSVSPYCYYSTDGKTWNNSNVNNLSSTSGVCYGNGMFVAVGTNSVCYSADGKTWETGSGVSGSLYDVCYGNGMFVTVGENNSCYYSINGISWTPGSGASGDLYGVCYGNGMFVVVGENILFYSINGISWTPGSGASGTLNNVCYGNGIFVAVGDNILFYSINGIVWIQATGVSEDLYSVCYGNGMYVAVGDNGSCYNIVPIVPMSENAVINQLLDLIKQLRLRVEALEVK